MRGPTKRQRTNHEQNVNLVKSVIVGSLG